MFSPSWVRTAEMPSFLNFAAVPLNQTDLNVRGRKPNRDETRFGCHLIVNIVLRSEGDLGRPQ